MKDLILKLEKLDRILTIQYPNVGYSYFKSLVEYDNDDDICIILDDLIDELDCTFIFSEQQVMKTDTLVYDLGLSTYYYYMLHFDNQLLYNKYLDKLIALTAKNLLFESNLSKAKAVPVIKTKSVTRTVKEKYFRQETVDMFTKKVTYLYESNTGSSFYSDNPDLLDAKGYLKKEKKPKKPKTTGKAVPLHFDPIFFNFNKKK